MSENQILAMAKEAIAVAVIVGGPILAVSLLIGLVVSVFQAMTQIQEQTLSFIPKLLGVAVILLILGPWMLNVMTTYTATLFTEIAKYARY
ncbi:MULTISPECIES: flagellar biosynthesis protein FliQ [Dehalobacter]|jgi:flagellar biosynthetic protein FliQ|uniref:Flagellar biosynthetic protein FliQ n=3 Tax=Dehalobacter restrictus TaxID=55583 RepID=A0A857DKJ0_9FIRM|nr:MULTISPECIES: flagellar biosynthesis protein FliQ [Dehalobacter]AHF10608.1 flagellar biosynthesis protein FliQ [Dehalobacter restrictus DSM 9455]MCG1026423.1 flagellar biosynthesis protein FliQ [Dehalobacter sp.]MDJ0305992.1 flagellar biosynthesis protein FliQ [Dehalobacter sp.]OCZ52357.1 EscS/YscS/HrcS family type III secretion system export apparatus protein [Dehalobacter sp. TeCB1]QHA01231.1 flagellar biosynthesis protein FliQ [Dehalobacter restrictus]